MDTDGWLEGLRRGSRWVIAPVRSRTAHGGAVAVGGHMGQAGVGVHGDCVGCIISPQECARTWCCMRAATRESYRALARVIALDFVFAT